ncbi:YjeF-related protein [Deinococcus proteolyticus MRP]|uniref:ADP-dependent (S)-NAD(P)H-hydrate dehydratase n=1 Tax=Deinococcus proteolyticus (strain ATCC 35074 / DSM 20540 / JCM 6276 / NBRC 101906 / NCIMB 13154 / VKM Ac-1939 / CCM 2703 / MRP) TaxID=693977 RepID=F0RKX3_DEIPM|nr:NAD(P)H-hydrate dehydratase [Deinococcus proteolyticus]ADY25746.1 YjeF-related protein [Deinococcus proteolyticus MRP]
MTEHVFTAAGIRALDVRLDAAGLLELAMEEAGRASAAALLDLAAGRPGPLALLAGGGANGGDALVAARHLHAAGREVQVLAAPGTHPLTQRNRERLAAVGVEVQRLSAAAVRALPPVAAWADGLLGTGVSGELRGELAGAVQALNARAGQGSGEPVLALDLPSGLPADRASAPPLTVQATRTLALSGYKPAHLFGEAAERCGPVALARLAVPPAWADAEAKATRPSDTELGAWLPRRTASTHKGTAGRVWVVGGSAGMEGAPAMAGVGALRAGAGLVTLHSEAELPLPMPELMRTRHADLGAWLAREQPRPDALALALGMGLGPQAPALARVALSWNIPTVLDADALQPELSGLGHSRCLWTPHPGEAARLLECTVAEVTADPLSAAATLQQRYGGVVVLKGGPSVVAWAGGLSVSRGGHPGMASAGMGDTLAGILAALLAAGMDSRQAAQAGVRLHARAGERAAQRFGYGLSASDVAAELGGAWADLSGPV